MNGYRAKTVFEYPLDVGRYRGQHLFLELRNITRQPVTVYLTQTDADPAVSAAKPCGRTLCATAVGLDLSAMVIGRDAPW